MDENKKEYSVVGTVTIGTDEYRDLIETTLSSARQADDYRSKYWSEQAKVRELNEQIKALEAKIHKCEALMRKTVKSDGELGENLVSVILRLFGEE